ncbi:MAG TPA: DUF5689 domain-containing protein [Bacteroidales bacterium]|nr:DUF5689 domain-containing protein [Bacteroidales bacterium]
MKYKYLILVLIPILMFLSSCIQNSFEEPPEVTIPVGEALTIGDLRQMYIDSILTGPYITYKFTNDYSVYAVVTMDDKSGNIYKSAFIQDNTGAVNLHMQASGGLYLGDSIRLNLNGCILGDYEGMLQIDSVHVEKNIRKIATHMFRTPKLLTIPQINTGLYQAQLIQLEDVQFIESDLGKTFADGENLLTENRTLEDCNGNQLIVRTSGYSSFASEQIPEGKGEIIGILSQHRDEWQLYIRKMDEVNMDGLRCGEYIAILEENFDNVVQGADIALTDWTNFGSILWKGVNNGYDTMARVGGSGENTSWLITPEFSIEEHPNLKLSFITRAMNLNQSSLKVYISSDFTSGSNPEDATWTEFTNVIIASSTNNTNSGDIDLSDYSGNVHIAFKYNCSATGSGSYFLDNVLVFTD